MTQHTKFQRPWSVKGTTHGVTSTMGVKAADGMWVAKIHPLNDSDEGRDNAEVTALLLAAAPEMLEALEACVRSFGDAHAHRRGGSCACDLAKAALAKARGEQ